MLFCLVVWLVLLVTCEAGQLVMFGTSTFQGPLDDMASGFVWEGIQSFFNMLASHPVLMALASGIALMIYPVGRLAWFFCYIDARVRRDCWDMELQIVQQAKHLENSR